MSDRVEEQIRLGLRLVAEEVQPPVPAREGKRRAPRRLVLAFAVAALIAVVAVVALGRSSAPSSGPQFIPDSFNYQPSAFQPGFPTGNGPPRTDQFSIDELGSVSASSSNVAWIVGTSYGKAPHTLAWRWDGTAWRDVPTPDLPNTSPYLAAVAATDESDAWAVGAVFGVIPAQFGGPPPKALIEHWDGTQWTIVPTPRLGAAGLRTVSAAGPDDVWAAGVLSAGRTRPLLLHWDGTTWSNVPLPWSTPRLDIYHVVATGSSSVWVVGTRFGKNPTSGQPVESSVLEYWDGQRWHAVRAPFGPDDPVQGFTATSGSDAWAVGAASERSGGRVYTDALAAHWNGSGWKLAPVPKRAGSANSYLQSVVAVRPDDVWAFGSSWGRPHTAVALFEHWDGRRWTVMPGVAPDFGSGWLTATSDGTAWAVNPSSCDNVLVRWDGNAWVYASHPHDRLPFPHHSLPRCTAAGGFTR